MSDLRIAHQTIFKITIAHDSVLNICTCFAATFRICFVCSVQLLGYGMTHLILKFSLIHWTVTPRIVFARASSRCWRRYFRAALYTATTRIGFPESSIILVAILGFCEKSVNQIITLIVSRDSFSSWTWARF